MSRSIHQTKKRVFGGKSKTEINAMCEKRDPDVMALVKKSVTKKRVKRERAAARIERKQGSRSAKGNGDWRPKTVGGGRGVAIA